MTIKIPKLSFSDWILIKLGKRRGLITGPLGGNLLDKGQSLNLDFFIEARKESFWRALFRKNKDFPSDLVDYYSLPCIEEQIKKRK